MKDHEITLREQVMGEFKPEVMKLVKFIPWLEKKSGQDVAHPYDGSQGEVGLPFTVYDGTLLLFVKEAKKTALMDKNYLYAYRRVHLKNALDELQFIEHAKIADFDVLKAILSRYVLEGMRKSIRWSEGVENRVFLEVLCKMKELVEIDHGPKDEYLTSQGMSLFEQIQQLSEKHNPPQIQ